MKVAIYIRTSTTEQNPELQLKDCKDYCKRRGWDDYDIYKEHISGYKDIYRPERDKIIKGIQRYEINHIVVWALDRWVRNREKLIEDITNITNRDAEIHSVKEEWLESVNIEGPLGKTIQEFLLGIVGSLAEMESSIKSERIKSAVRTKEGVTRSYKGKKWGRRNLTSRIKEEVIKLHNKGHSMREISKVVIRYDKNQNEKNISLGAVHKILHEKQSK